MKKIKYYKNSGKVSIAFIPTNAITLLVVIPILSILYAYALVKIPYLFLHLVIFIAALVLLAFIATLNIYFSKIRNSLVSGISAIILFLWFFYLQWSVWVYAVLSDLGKESLITSLTSDTIMPDVFEMALRPNQLLIMVKSLGDDGINFTWFVEFLGFSIAALVFAVKYKNDPFSEKAKAWHEEEEITIAPILKEDLLDAISENNYQWFEKLEHVEVQRDNYCKITLFISPEDDNYLSLTVEVAEPGNKGDVNFKSIELIRNVAIDKKITELLLEKRQGNTNESESVDHSVESTTEQSESAKSISQIDEVPPKAETTAPEVIIEVNTKKNSKRILWSLIELIFGVVFIVLGVMTDHTVSFALGGITILFALFSLVGGASKSEDRAFAIKLNPSYITISDIVARSGSEELIPLNNIRELSLDVSRQGGVVTLTIILNNMKIEDKDYLNLDIELAKVDWLEFKEKLDSLIGKSTKERIKILDNWNLTPKTNSRKKR